MGKFEESFDRKIIKSITLGKENSEILQRATNWCKHFRSEMKSAGLLAQMSELPIGSIEISCQYAEKSWESINLSWVIPNFIIQNCAECAHHNPNGDIFWGEEIIHNHKLQIQEHNQAEQVRQEQLRAVRERLRELPRLTKKDAKLDERQILTYIEELFSEEEKQREEAAKLLIQAARIGADLFSDVAINILIEQSWSEDFASNCLPVCVKLAEQRKDLSPRFKDIAFIAIARGIYPEIAAEILFHLGQNVEYPLEKRLIKNLISQQIHYRPVGGWNNSLPSYSNITKILTCCYDADSWSIIEPFQLLLKEDDKYVRVNVCGALKLLQDIRPQIGIDLLPELIASLNLYDDPYENSADGKAKECIARALCYAPLQVDEYLVSIISQKRPAVQQEIIDVYRIVIQRYARNRPEAPHKLTEVQVEEQISVNRCLEFIKDEFLDMDVRHQASECLKSACKWVPKAVISSFDALLGYYALICTQDEPRLPPRIILPNQKAEDPRLASLNRENCRQKWNFIKSNLLQSLGELTEHKPEAIAEIVIDCYENLDTKAHKNFQSALLKLLSKVGKQYSLQPKVIPLLMDGLMDFESPLIRASAIQAVQEMYRYSKSNPPKNIVDVLIVHLHDNYIIVHKAVIHAFSWHRSWLTQEQAIEALNLMIGWLYTYKNKPYDLNEIAEAIINTVSRFAHLKNIAIQHIAAVLPTNEVLVDEGIVEDMIRCVDPNEPTAVIVAHQLGWCLANYDRDRYNSYEDSQRAKMFKWLHEIPRTIYNSIQSDLFEFAKQLAKKDAWEACYFASLFAKHDDFPAEQEVLTLAASSLNQEKKYSKVKSGLELLGAIALSNIYLQDGDIEKAYSLLSEIRESEI